MLLGRSDSIGPRRSWRLLLLFHRHVPPTPPGRWKVIICARRKACGAPAALPCLRVSISCWRRGEIFFREVPHQALQILGRPPVSSLGGGSFSLNGHRCPLLDDPGDEQVIFRVTPRLVLRWV